MSMYVKLAAAAAVAVGLSVAATTAQAETFQVEVFSDEQGWKDNDCSGEFNPPQTGFDACTVNDSYVIAKYDVEEGEWTTNETEFPQITQDDFTISGDETEWTWEYHADDPVVRYWVVKHGNEGFRLFWEVEDTPENRAICEENGGYNDDCLALAVVLTSGTWTGDYSHITWYDTPNPIPLPAGLILFLTGLAGVGFLGRYKAKRREPELV
jgi:hypothetical protein